MSDNENLEEKSKEELIKLIESLREDVAALEFLLSEYENAQQSLGKAVESHLSDYLKSVVTTKTVGEA